MATLKLVYRMSSTGFVILLSIVQQLPEGYFSDILVIYHLSRDP